MDADAIRALEEYRAEFADAYGRVEAVLRDKLGHVVTGRPAKSTLAIRDKLRRQKTRLTQIQDIAGCRVIVPSIVAQDLLVNAMKVMFDDVQVDDKREQPTNSYRAVHVIVREGGKLVEVQVRTKLQHSWAELSEKIADTYGHEIKYGAGAEWAVKFLSDLSAQIGVIERMQLRRTKLEREGVGLTFAQRKKQARELDRQIRLERYKIREIFDQVKDR